MAQKKRIDNITLKRNIKMHVNAGTGHLTTWHRGRENVFPKHAVSIIVSITTELFNTTITAYRLLTRLGRFIVRHFAAK